jgi:hypothetical protein
MTLITQKSGKDDKNTAKDSTAKGANRSRRDLPEDDYVGTPFSMSRIRSGVLQSTAVKVVLGLLIVIFAFTLFAGRPRRQQRGPRRAGPAPATKPSPQVAGHEHHARGVFKLDWNSKCAFARHVWPQGRPR